MNSDRKISDKLFMINSYFDENSDIEIINLCSSDGFPIYSLFKKNILIEEYKLSAISSTLCSLSNSASKDISDQQLIVCSIETELKNILFFRVSIFNQDYVLTIMTCEGVSLGESHYKANKLANLLTA